MGQSPSSEANRSSGIQKIPLLLQNPKVQPPVTALNQINLVLALPFHFLKINFHIILSSRTFKVSLSLKSSPPSPSTLSF
jgi:hypothetical protein